ncbi:hypothetical protein [Rhizorhabdus wittichii]|uniref:hypothetical protein n=1 Tax=Rhizorhabdus wittichii TaxID=160791 RepID=UPI00192C818A|nr:hypothetical protein [Rhizorhabdus wittichii]
MTTVSSLSEFIEAILGRTADPSRIVTYRGHGNAGYILSPSIFRKPVTRENEHLLLRELVAAQVQRRASDQAADSFHSAGEDGIRAGDRAVGSQRHRPGEAEAEQ